MITVSGVSDSIKNFLRGPIAKTPVAPPPPSQGAGLPIVWKQPTIEAPPNASAAVLAQVDSSSQLEQNTLTGAGTGAGRSSFPVMTIIPSGKNLALLGALGFILVLAVMWDKGKL